MAYATRNFKTKRELVTAVKAGERVTYYQPGGMFDAPRDGTVFLEGPHFPKPHTWYAQCEAKDGVIVRVK